MPVRDATKGSEAGAITHCPRVTVWNGRPQVIMPSIKTVSSKPIVALNPLTANQGAREGQVLLRFGKVRLNTEGLFVMSNG